MGIEDRLRRALGHAAEPGEERPELWPAILRGAQRRRRAFEAARVAPGAVVAAAFAGLVLWAAVARHPAIQPEVPPGTGSVIVQSVELQGAGGFWKVGPLVRNLGSAPSGAVVTCRLVAGTAVSPPASMTLRFVPAGGGVRAEWIAIQGFPHGTAVARCTARPVPPVSPAPVPSPAPPAFVPDTIAFFDGAHGLAAGSVWASSCGADGACPGEIRATSDGGHTWSVVYRTKLSILDLTALAPRFGWAVVGPVSCGGRMCPRPGIVATTDGGRTWHLVARGALPRTISFPTPTLGWGVVGGNPQTRLARTRDGGRTWQVVGRPCATPFSPALVSFPTPSLGWLLCTTQPGAGQQGRAVLATIDGGRTWRLLAEGDLFGGPSPPPGVTDLGSSGYPESMFFLADGHGWIGYGGPAATLVGTADGGVTWQTVLAGSRFDPSAYAAAPAWFASDSVGYALVGSAPPAMWLVRTAGGGGRWAAVDRWAWSGP